jgi:hypothetical protein
MLQGGAGGTENTLNAITFGICELMTEGFGSTSRRGMAHAVEGGYKPEVTAPTRGACSANLAGSAAISLRV